MSSGKYIPPEIEEILSEPVNRRSREDLGRVREWVFQNGQFKELLLHALKNLGNQTRTAAAEDVLQEFCIKRLDAVIGGFEPEKCPGDFWGYLVLCLRRFCHREGRNLRKERDFIVPFTEKAKPDENYFVNPEDFPDNSIPLPDEKLSLDQINSFLRQFLNKLDSKYRKVFEKHYFEEKSLAEIAEELNISKVNAKVRLLRVRQQIYKSLPVLLQYFQS